LGKTQVKVEQEGKKYQRKGHAKKIVVVDGADTLCKKKKRRKNIENQEGHRDGLSNKLKFSKSMAFAKSLKSDNKEETGGADVRDNFSRKKKKRGK